MLVASAIAVVSLSPAEQEPRLDDPSEPPAEITDWTFPPDVSKVPYAGMLRVPGGHFRMGADSGGEPDERPAHDVVIAPFWLDVTEVTNAAYAECVRDGGCRKPDSANAARHHLR